MHAPQSRTNSSCKISSSGIVRRKVADRAALAQKTGPQVAGLFKFVRSPPVTVRERHQLDVTICAASMNALPAIGVPHPSQHFARHQNRRRQRLIGVARRQ
jgi:hypothetical protein